MEGDIDTFDWQSPGKQTYFRVDFFVDCHHSTVIPLLATSETIWYYIS